jgi:thiol reductant ABC exporter CydD subunit
MLLLVVVVARAAATSGFETIGTHAAAGVVSQLRLDLVGSRLKGSPTALDGAESAEVATAAVSGVEALEGLFGRYLPQLVLAAVVPVAVIVLVASLDLVSAGLMLLTLPLVPVFFWLIGRATGARARERWEAMSLLSTHFLDVVRGLPTLRAFNRGEAQAARIEQVSDQYRRTTMGTLRLAFLSGTVLELAATLGVALVAVTVGVRLVNGGIEFEPALTVLVLAPELYLPLRNLAAGFHASADGAAVADRLLGLIERPAAVQAGTQHPPAASETPIGFESVSFSYPGRSTAALSDVSLTIAPGETVALVGPSGGGKSTLATLLLRFHAPASGRIVVGNTDLATCDPGAWHRQIAWVPQDPTLFRGTIADNIRLGDPGASDARVREAADLAGAAGVIDRLPEGYETIVVGEGGRTLSTGERQRIAIARAFLRNAPLVVLDEPTANLDPASARIVGEAVERLRVGRTMLLIAHDAALAGRADRIVTIVDGRVLEPSR